MAIVPDDARLEVEAMVQNRDIGFIRPGQKVDVKLETFLFTKYGTIPGEVTSISRDAVADEKAGLIYPIRVALDRDRSEEHTSELQSLMRYSYAVFCLKKQKNTRYTL